MAALDTSAFESTKAAAAEIDKAEALEFDAGRPYQLLVAEAEARARFEEEQMKSRDGDRVRELISVRQNDDHLRVVAPPSIINLGVRGELRMRIAAQNASEVVYAVGRDGRLPASLARPAERRTRAATAPGGAPYYSEGWPLPHRMLREEGPRPVRYYSRVRPARGPPALYTERHARAATVE